MKKKLFTVIETLFLVVAISVPVLAASTSKVNSGINKLTDLVLTVVGGVGVIFLAWGLLDFGTAVASHETSQQMQGVKKAVAGLVIIAVPALIAILK